MVKRMYYAAPHMKKSSAQKDAERLRKKGQKVRVTPADLYAKSRGWRWQTKVIGIRKKR